ncbi:glycosyltransferase family 4 protein [Shimwellia pseudoproteus]|uniref:glycosyltransferase family 4 protein n=1 Tax=Shimwellia pseudoproteus TaxID=570012 RepID=UPI0018EAD2AF|nr:glycosyltransferase family 4 protein [Shimwellia pseudoproteus]MBJ3816926.1 glycosyltransferase family 4 protein [Shimwellia pseudoproteus]
MIKRITVLGTRGIPDVLGGVETHCQNLYPTIKAQHPALDICVIARSPYVKYRRSEYRGVKTRAIWAPKKKSLEAIVHSVLAAFSTRFDGSDVVHVHAIGPGLVVPLLRLLGKKVVFTHHGPDYDRQKWGRVARLALVMGERMAVKYANEVIVISEVINRLIQNKYRRMDAHLIYNGVNPPVTLEEPHVQHTLGRFGITAGHYIVAVGRFVEEKGFHDLITAWRQSGVAQPLVLVGDADHATPYSEKLRQLAADNGVILTGFLRGAELQAVFSRAGLFVMPSYHEGLPIALLEAMSWSLPVVVSDIPANLEVGLDPQVYFPVGQVDRLAAQIAARCDTGHVDYSRYLQRYDWATIAAQTMQVYQQTQS